MYGIGSFITKSARFFPDRLAVGDIAGALTYAQLNGLVNRIANYMLGIGLKKGSRLGFICDNCKEFAMLWLATQKIGVVAVLLNYRATSEELSRDVRRSGCEALFFSPKLKSILSLRDICGSGVRYFISFCDDEADGHISLDNMCQSADGNEPEVDIEEMDYSTILYTSGSTGLSKGVIRTHRMVLEYAMQMAAEHEYYKTEPICILSHSPLFHTGGLSMLMKAIVLSGTYIGINGVNPETVVKLIEKYRVTQLFLVPPVNIMRISSSEAARDRDISSVNCVWATGGKLSKEYVLEMLRLFPGARIKTSYGATEFCCACSISFCCTPQELEDSPDFIESVGYIGQFVDLRIVGEDGEDVSTGESGEVWVSSPFVMLGYLDDAEETAKALTNGWYHTGDIFRMDEKGLLYFVDRKSAMIKTGGENVFPNEVESVMRGCPALADCAVIGIPDSKWGEAVAAAVVPRDECFDMNEIVNYARDNLAGYRKPRYYLVLKDLPRTASGKIDRRVLLDEEKYKFKDVKEIYSAQKQQKNVKGNESNFFHCS